MDVMEWVSNQVSDEVYLYSGYDDAFLGLARRNNNVVAVYDLKKCMNILIESGMTEEEAVDELEFNSLSANFGSHTAIFIIAHFPENTNDSANNNNGTDQ